MCRSMVDIQSPTAEITRGKKRRKKKKETTGQKYNGLPYYIGRPSCWALAHISSFKYVDFRFFFVEGILFVLISVSVNKYITALLTLSHRTRLRARSITLTSRLDDRFRHISLQCFRPARFRERFVLEHFCLCSECCQTAGTDFAYCFSCVSVGCESQCVKSRAYNPRFFFA